MIMRCYELLDVVGNPQDIKAQLIKRGFGNIYKFLGESPNGYTMIEFKIHKKQRPKLEKLFYEWGFDEGLDFYEVRK
tara:strand:- start:1198 stop:1428 length:231 start_codon:yes stop_codon:yes gene_type:complete